ncbi:MAG TPA: lipopolysaccharide biosynthesis protein [Bacteroidales bacterium]|nr:lipopolysaccharide biosynthesis protein [Bacteroidales bacterium]OQB59453.1 MAG: Teichuronic acid biosynthesis protein TuaB [Bacteroidetes bacterium ADurb.Bin145]HHU98682.1 lipopolysaccharide biosynthesis protein [Bacteroidales bacterium]HOC04086.1 lipopolysaccharide biosynthesis protein [Bacteroidales bacterium]HOE25023.1 lipopolysaccharide biosynthesis protein [Bacteroidales bacterium]
MFWSFSDSMSTQLSQFIAGIILARILSPEEFGLIGMITVFVSISQSISDGGFGDALIRKKDASEADYSTAFYFNLIASAVIFAILWLTAPAVAGFYGRPELVDIERVLAITILINAFGIVQRTQLTKNINFRMHMKVSLTASVVSGVAAIIMALTGFGVWSLVWRSIIRSLIRAVMLWYTNRWVPFVRFSRESFRSLFSFGSKLLISNLIDTLYNNIFLLIIGKFYSASQLGFFTRADQFSRLASRNLTNTVQRVSYPVLSLVQDENTRLREGYRKLLNGTMYITFFLMLGMTAMARPMILTLIGEKWLPSVEYLQLLCLAAALYPLQVLNMNILSIKGRSDLLLKLEIVKKLLAIPVIMLGIFLGIRALLIGMVLHSLVSSFLNSYYSGRLIYYPTADQLRDVMPSFLVALLASLCLLLLKFIPDLPPYVVFSMQVLMMLILAVVFGRFFRLEGYIEIRNIITEKVPWLDRYL